MSIKTLLPHQHRERIDFDAIRLKLASPDAILRWSHGEVTKPETINYRTQKPEKDGLFDERIFGPTKDFECYCGKYKRIRYRGIVCEKCGVEVTRSIVRRERMAHIKLASPVAHIWFLRGVPSKIGLLLDLSIQDLEKIAYFANFIITEVNEELHANALQQIEVEYKTRAKQIEAEFNQKIHTTKSNQKLTAKEQQNQIKTLEKMKTEKISDLDLAKETARQELSLIRPKKIISENTYQDLSLKYGQIFEASIGAEALYQLLAELDLEQEIEILEAEIAEAARSQQKRLTKRLKLIKSLAKNDLRPEWMIISMLPVIPPDLRPMVPLDGGRYAASDLNDLYRRVINRNNRLKRLLELNAPEVIVRNEKRMLQEAIDALIDNTARRGKTVTASTGQKRTLKSLADSLKGKQGRFRQNLLGKRTDYSGRSVIVVGPHLKLDECGLPKTMALEIFKPFVIARLIQRELVHNIKSANRFIETGAAEVWDILEEITKDSMVMLNRAPTLHRLGIQAFKPILIEGKAIQVHPLVCPAFNADFDGDQMAVHLPLTDEARAEARDIMVSAKNLLKPGDGTPIVKPNQDVIWGSYYLTYNLPGHQQTATRKNFSSMEEALLAYELGHIKLQELVVVVIKNKKIETTAGRLIFNTTLPSKIGFINKTMNSTVLKELVAEIFRIYDTAKVANCLDDLKDLTLKYLTYSGLSWGMDDLPPIPEKPAIIKAAEQKIIQVKNQFEEGLLTNSERYDKVIEIWTGGKNQIITLAKDILDDKSSVFTIIDSKARGSWEQLGQMVGMRGNLVNPAGRLIELPVKASFKEGMDVLEYFISTHGARKGLSDTALKTASAGYLTRRLVDVAQNVIISETDCGETHGFEVSSAEIERTGSDINWQLTGRLVAQTIKHPKTGKLIAKRGQLIDEKLAQRIAKAKVESIFIRSVLKCQTRRGICQTCYGWDLGHNTMVGIGTAVGIIGAQSIGEPGTQLTMRTFHTGGVAGLDITQGLPRVEEIFEARPIKRAAVLAPFAGQVKLEDLPNSKQSLIKISGQEIKKETLTISQSDLDQLAVKDGQKVKKGQTLLKKDKHELKSPSDGVLQIEEVDQGTVKLHITSQKDAEKEITPSIGTSLWVKDGAKVDRGDQLTDGNIDLHELYRLKKTEAVQRYILNEIQYIYSSQGQNLNPKHIEVIARQMFSRVLVSDTGDTDLLPGDVVEYSQVLEANDIVAKTKARPAKYMRLLLGIQKAALSTESFLSAASFQETSKILIDAAVTGRVDHLKGLKENVIIGRLIPAGTGFEFHQKRARAKQAKLDLTEAKAENKKAD